MGQDSEFMVNGFSFDTEQEANAASMELKKIQYLESRIDYADTRKVQAIYEKAVKEQFFHTAVGLFYLKGIRDFLTREDERYEAVLPMVPVPSYRELEKDAKEQETKEAPAKSSENGTGAKTKTAERKRSEKKQQELEKQRQRFFVSVVINFVLVIAVIVMFWIAMHTKEPNILNYEKAIKNQYASWEQELTQREKVIREKELLLFRESGEE